MENIIVLFEVTLKAGKMENYLKTAAALKEQGRMNDFIDYKITVVNPIRCYTMCSRKEAPQDSNQYFNL